MVTWPGSARRKGKRSPSEWLAYTEEQMQVVPGAWRSEPLNGKGLADKLWLIVAVTPFKASLLRDMGFKPSPRTFSAPAIRNEARFTLLDEPEPASKRKPRILGLPLRRAPLRQEPSRRRAETMPVMPWTKPSVRETARSADLEPLYVGLALAYTALGGACDLLVLTARHVQKLPDPLPMCAGLIAVGVVSVVLYEVHRVITMLEHALLYGFLVPIYMLGGSNASGLRPFDMLWHMGGAVSRAIALFW